MIAKPEEVVARVNGVVEVANIFTRVSAWVIEWHGTLSLVMTSYPIADQGGPIRANNNNLPGCRYAGY